MRTGVAVVFAVGATVAVTTIEHEPGAVSDLQALLDRLIPVARRTTGTTSSTADTNAHAHLRAAIIGPSESVPIVDGALGLGTWQQIVLLDFDDRAARARRLRPRARLTGADPATLRRPGRPALPKWPR